MFDIYAYYAILITPYIVRHYTPPPPAPPTPPCHFAYAAAITFAAAITPLRCRHFIRRPLLTPPLLMPSMLDGCRRFRHRCRHADEPMSAADAAAIAFTDIFRCLITPLFFRFYERRHYIFAITPPMPLRCLLRLLIIRLR